MGAEASEWIFFGIFVFLTLSLYFLPLLVANSRGHKNTTSIGVLTLLVGWTFLGWVIALVWSFSDNTRTPIKS